jgi:hypothetical protein
MTTTAREIGGGNNKEQQGLAVGVFTLFSPPFISDASTSTHGWELSLLQGIHRQIV